MSRRRYRRIVAGVLALTTLAFVGIIGFMPREPDRTEVAKIQPGMSPAEVEQVLGRQSDEAYESGPKPGPPPHGEYWHPAMTEKKVRVEKWDTQTALIYVWYIDGVVESTNFFERAQVPLWKRLLEWVAD